MIAGTSPPPVQQLLLLANELEWRASVRARNDHVISHSPTTKPGTAARNAARYSGVRRRPPAQPRVAGVVDGPLPFRKGTACGPHRRKQLVESSTSTGVAMHIGDHSAPEFVPWAS